MGLLDAGRVQLILGAEHTLVVLDGEIDAQLTSDLDLAVQCAQAAGLPVHVDAGGVTFANSTAVTALARLAVHTPGRLVLVGAPEALQFLLQLTSLVEMIDVRPDAEPSVS